MATGIVKWFNSYNGEGYIQPDTGGTFVLVKLHMVEQAKAYSFAEGMKVEYDLMKDEKGRDCAINIKPLKDDEKYLMFLKYWFNT